MADRDAVTIWTITHRPRDLPGAEYVARAHFILPGGTIEVAADHLEAASLAAIRAALPPGLICLGRSAEDDPVIIESWI
jgi:hypothetical protein